MSTRLNSDLISFFAPAMLALIVQHAAVSLGALAIVRERLSGTFELYQIAPTSNLQLLLGKYLAYFVFVLAVSALLLGVLLSPLLRVPLFGDPWRVALTLVLMTLASIGLGLALSLIAVSERQAVQFSMLALLAIVFFGGFALPLDALKQPAMHRRLRPARHLRRRADAKTSCSRGCPAAIPSSSRSARWRPGSSSSASASCTGALARPDLPSTIAFPRVLIMPGKEAPISCSRGGVVTTVTTSPAWKSVSPLGIITAPSRRRVISNASSGSVISRSGRPSSGESGVTVTSNRMLPSVTVVARRIV